MGRLYRQLRVLLWKNVVLQKRHPIATALEYLLPIAFVASLVAMYYAFATVHTPTSEYSGRPWTPLPLQALAWRLRNVKQQLAIVEGSGASARAGADQLQSWLTSTYPSLPIGTILGSTGLAPCLADLSLPGLGTVLRRFPSEAALTAHIKSDSYSSDGTKLWAAIVVNAGPPAWDYAIRLNASESASTEPPYYDALQRGADLETMPEKYVDVIPNFGDALAAQEAPDPIAALPMPGFLSLQLAVDRMIINRTVPTAALDVQQLLMLLSRTLETVRYRSSLVLAAAAGTLAGQAAAGNATAAALVMSLQGSLQTAFASEAYMPQQVSLVAFPVLSFSSNGAYGVLTGFMAIYLTLSLLYPVARLIRGIVAEKESKIREGMSMMGMGHTPLLLSWLLTYGFLFAVIACASTILSKATFFSHTDGGLLLLFYLLFAWSSMAWAFLVSAVFSRAKSASSIGVVSFLALVFPLYGVQSPTATRSAKLGASICAPTAFGLIVNILAGYENEGQGVGFGDKSMGGANPFDIVRGYSVGEGLLWLAGDTVLYLLLGLYLDAVLPRAYGVPRPWYFPATRQFWAEVQESWRDEAGSMSGGGEDGGKVSPAPSFRPVQLPAGGEVPPAAAGGGGGKTIEPLDTALQAKLADARCISVRGLVKTFSTPDGPKVAVDRVDLDCFEGQILALLGHNGAGKSTTISMLTGLIPPDEGLMSVLGVDLSTRQGMAWFRQQLGVVPQHDVLWPELTVHEHLQVFAEVKRVAQHTRDAAIMKVIAEVGLTEKTHAHAASLSGGQKRKLSVAIALLGGSRIVVLDEPTSGMDPYSRRFTWQILQNAREGRVIILTTHFMDEADILGDRIAIMAHGKVRCCGTPLYLKEKYGAGYLLSVQKRPDCVSERVLSIVQAHVPQATVHSDVGTELSMRVPYDSPLATVCAQLEQQQGQLGIETFSVSVTTAEEVFLRVAAEADEEIEAEAAKEQVGQVAVVPGPAMAIEAAELNTQTQASSVAATSWDVLKERALAREASASAIFLQHLGALLLKRSQGARRDLRSLAFAILIPVCTLLAGLALVSNAFPVEGTSLPMSTANYNTDPRGLAHEPMYPHVLPAFAFKGGFAAGGGSPGPAAISSAAPSAAISSILGCIPAANASRADSRWMSPSQAAGVVSRDEYGFFAAAAAAQQQPGAPSRVDRADAQGMATYLVSSRASRAASVFGAVTWRDRLVSGADPAGLWLAGGPQVTQAAEYVLLVNTTGPHTGSLYMNLLHSAMYAHVRGDPGCAAGAGGGPTTALSNRITVRNHPLPFTSNEVTLLASYMSGSAATLAMIAFAFIPAAIAAGIVKEAETGAKHQQLLAGVSIPAYWLSHWMFDMAVYAFTALVCIGLYGAFMVTDFVSGSKGRLGALFTVYILYGSSVIPWTYLLSFLWKSHSSAQNGVLIINIIAGVILCIASMILSQTAVGGGAACAADRGLKYVYRLAPPFGLGNSLYMMSFLNILPALNANCRRAEGATITEEMMKPIDAWHADAAGSNIAYMAVLTVGYMAAVILLDMALCNPSFLLSVAAWRQSIRLGGKAESTAATRPPPPPALLQGLGGPLGTGQARAAEEEEEEEEDQDVAAEAKRVDNPACDDVIQVKHLRKLYPGRAGQPPKLAVRDLSFGIPLGEVFGFLGINGAGKSTTMSVLTGGTLPTDGTAVLAGFNAVSEQPAVRRLLGYCPQFDSLLDHLTTREHLQLYARIKGVPEKQVPAVVREGMEELGLTPFANKVATTLSGGNKRKLCVAVALVSRPPLLVLDEPTTGVDAVSKRFMWTVLTRIAAKDKLCSIILVSHSMEEAEALCTRIGIMVGGRLRCLGSSTHLKARFGEGYQLDMRLRTPDEAEVQAVLQRFPADLVDAVPRAALPSLCSHLGDPQGQRLGSVKEGGRGWSLHAAYQRSGHAGVVPAAVVAAWWAEEERVSACTSFVTSTCPALSGGGTHLQEQQGLWLRYAISARDGQGQTRQLSAMFAALESRKSTLHMASFSVGQTSLEQVFVHFAGQQEEEGAPAPGTRGKDPRQGVQAASHGASSVPVELA